MEKRTQSDKEIRRLGKRFQALRSVLRLRILVALSKGESNVRDLERELHISQPLLSWHLVQLRQAGFVEAERVGREVRYRILPVAFQGLVSDMAALLDFSFIK